jgi:hypothetical protein
VGRRLGEAAAGQREGCDAPRVERWFRAEELAAQADVDQGALDQYLARVEGEPRLVGGADGRASAGGPTRRSPSPTGTTCNRCLEGAPRIRAQVDRPQTAHAGQVDSRHRSKTSRLHSTLR